MQRIVHRDVAVDVDGNGFCAIGRLALLRLLQRECAAAGVQLDFGTPLDSLDAVRRTAISWSAPTASTRWCGVRMPRAFGPRIEWLTNKFVWYGTTQRFDCLTLTFRENEHGTFVAHHYRYAPDRSTFIVECDAATLHRAGLAGHGRCRVARATARRCSRPTSTAIRSFPTARCGATFRCSPNARWSAGNARADRRCAAHRPLFDRLRHAARLRRRDRARPRARRGGRRRAAPACATFERERRPVVEKIVAAANSSSYWYERMADKMALSPVALAYDYMTRSGRMSDERLAEMAPRFMARVRAERVRRADAARRRIADPVPDDAPGATRDRLRRSRALQRGVAPVRQPRRAPGQGRGALRRATTHAIASSAALADRAGDGLPRMGLARGGRVLMLLDDTPEYVAAIFGAMRAGFVPVLVNTLSPPELVAYFLQRQRRGSGVRRRTLRGVARVTTTSRRAGCARSSTSGACPQMRRCRRARCITSGTTGSRRSPARSSPRTRIATTWRSGCTARARPAGRRASCTCITTRSYTCARLWPRRAAASRADDVVFSPPKIFFAYGFGNSLTFPFAAGATTVLLPGRPEPEAVFADDRAAPSDGAVRLADAVRRAGRRIPGSRARDLSSLRLCVSAAETLSSELFAEWRRRYGLAIVEGLGSTEVLHIYLSNTPATQKPGASGQRVPGYELRLTDPDGRDVAHGRVRHPLGARPLAGAVLLEPSGQDRGDDARRLDLHRRPLSPRRRRLPFLRGARRRSRQGERPVGASARGRALPRRASAGARVRGARGRRRESPDHARGVRRVARPAHAGDATRRRRAAALRQVAAHCRTSIRASCAISTRCRRPARARSIGRRSRLSRSRASAPAGPRACTAPHHSASSTTTALGVFSAPT